MRMSGAFVVGLMSLLGSEASADLPIVQQAQTTWGGCGYFIQVEQDVDPIPYPQPLYRIVLRSTVVSADTCTLPPQRIELGTSKLEPGIAIAADERGLVTAHSYGTYVRTMGPDMMTQVIRWEPTTLTNRRSEWIRVGNVPYPGAAGGPGSARVTRLTIFPKHVEVRGTRGGNLLFLDSDYMNPDRDYRFETSGTGFAVLFPDFFGVNQKPPYLYAY